MKDKNEAGGKKQFKKDSKAKFTPILTKAGKKQLPQSRQITCPTKYGIRQIKETELHQIHVVSLRGIYKWPRRVY